MKKILPLFLAMASLGLMASTTIDVSTLTKSETYSATDTYIIEGTVTSPSSYSLTFSGEGSIIILNGCQFPTASNVPAIHFAGPYDDSPFTLKASADSSIGDLGPAIYSEYSGPTITSDADNAGTITLKGGYFDGSQSGDPGSDFNGCIYAENGFTLDKAKIKVAQNSNGGKPVLYCQAYYYSYLTIKDTTLNYNLDNYIGSEGAPFCIDSNSSIYLGGSKGFESWPYSLDWDYTGTAIIPNACPTAGQTYAYDVKDSASVTAGTYNGPGHGSTDASSKALYMHLPEGTYTVAVGGVTLGGKIETNEETVFTVVPEPCFGLLGLLGLCFLRRK